MDKTKKKRIKRYISWACLAAVVLLLTVMPLLAKKEAAKDGPHASVLSAQAELSPVSMLLQGGGTLEAQEEETVTIPSGVKITRFLVKNGEVVTEGTPVAEVDKVSVMTAITQVNETLEFLQEELEKAQDETVDSTISAAAGGRVKKIFAREGESVQEVMLRDGALALLSIDGLMAVKIENEVAVTTGESALIRFPDGGVVSGRVESSLDGVKIITLEDEGYAVGTEVTVSKADGQAIGAGHLYVHNAWTATGYSGTVSRIHAKEENTLNPGSTLFTLEDTEYTAQLQYRAGQYREYTELLQKLHKMYESGTIDAPCDGVISGVDEDSAHLLAAEEGEWEAEFLSNSQEKGGYRVILLSNSSYPDCTGEEDCPAPEHDPDIEHKCINSNSALRDCPAKVHNSTCIKSCTRADQAQGCTAGIHYKECIHSCDHGTDTKACGGTKNHYPDCIENCDPSKGTACPSKVQHKKTCIMRCAHGDTEEACDGEGQHHLDCIHSCDPAKGSSCPASKHKADCELYGMTFVAFAAKVDSVGTGALNVYTSSKVYYVERSGTGYVLKDGAQVDEKLLVTSAQLPAANAAAFQKGDILLVVTGQKPGQADTYIGPVLYKRTTPTLPGMGDFPGLGGLGGFGSLDLSGMMGGFAGFGNYSGMVPQTEDEGFFDLEGSPLMTITPQKEMVLVITLDEQDIGKVSVGMEAMVKVEALRGQQFPAKVTKIGTAGTNSGGSSKFTAELTLAVTGDMLAGMSATARIALKTKEDVLTVPLAALDDLGAKTVVYTARDEKTGQPASPVEVETGISDGAYVEILSGLEEGDTVYYSYYDTLELDTSAEAERFTFG